MGTRGPVGAEEEEGNMVTEVKFVYIGFDPCGCALEMVVDNPDHAHDVQVAIRRMIKHGHIERVPLEQARARFCLVPHTKKEGCPHPSACPSATPPPAADAEA